MHLSLDYSVLLLNHGKIRKAAVGDQFLLLACLYMFSHGINKRVLVCSTQCKSDMPVLC